MRRKLRRTLTIAIVLSVILSAFSTTKIDAATNVKLNREVLNLTIGDSYKLKVNGTKNKVKWSVKQKSIATVATNGQVKAVGAGSTYVYAKVNKKSYKCKVTVSKYKKLKSINNYQGERYAFPDIIVDSYGKTHNNVLSLDTSYNAYISYNLDGKYERIKGNIVAYKDTGSGAKMNVAIFADDVLVYSTANFTRQDEAKSFNINLKGVNKLSIKTSNVGEFYSGFIFLTESYLAVNTEKTNKNEAYAKLSDLVTIDSKDCNTNNKLFKDSYGNFHSSRIHFIASYEAYALYNLDGKYSNITGKIVTNESTGAGASMIVQIYLDGQLVFERVGINKTIESIPFNLNIKGHKVLKINTYNMGEFSYGDCFIVDDKLF